MKSDFEDRGGGAAGGRRRRFWTAPEKARIIAESMEPGASMSDVARRHGVNANLVFTWRRQARSAPVPAAPVELVPVSIAPAPAPDLPVSSGRMEIVLVGGERISVGADVDAGALSRVVKALSRR